MNELIERLRKLIEPIAKRNIQLLFKVGRMMREYKNAHNYAGSMTELCIEIANGLNLSGYAHAWFELAARASNRFTQEQRETLIRHKVGQTDIRALLLMDDRDGWIEDIRTGKVKPPYLIMKTYSQKRNNYSLRDGTTTPTLGPDTPERIDDDRLEFILANIYTQYGIQRVDRIIPKAKQRAKRAGGRQPTVRILN